MQASAVADAQRDDDTLTVADLISAYEKGVEELRLAVAGMTGEQLRSRPVVGKWSTLEVACHIADCEQFFADRMKRTGAFPGCWQRGRHRRLQGPHRRSPAADVPGAGLILLPPVLEAGGPGPARADDS